MENAKLEETATETDGPFYRPLEVARELSFTTAELERRLELTNEIVRNLREIAKVDLDEIGSRIASLSCAMKLLREFEREES
jgi:hypothetical protein